MTGTPSVQDVADSLALTVERQGADGQLWCPPRDGIVVRRWVLDRSASLGAGIRRVVRLARLMAIADVRGYTHFLYARLTALRARHFQHAFEAAAREGRLSADVAMLSDRSARLQESKGSFRT